MVTHLQRNVNDEMVTLEQLLLEFNLHMPMIALEKSMKSLCRSPDSDVKYLLCKYEELQRHHGYPEPFDCNDFPNLKPNQCDECESILIDCIRNCAVEDFQCSSTCNREFADCESNCEI